MRSLNVWFKTNLRSALHLWTHLSFFASTATKYLAENLLLYKELKVSSALYITSKCAKLSWAFTRHLPPRTLPRAIPDLVSGSRLD